jgi:hypothetical protein
MVSVFDRTTDLAPVKLSFSSAEWCGHVYNELLFYPKEIKGQCFSYFENESAATTIEAKEGGISEDNLFVLLRGLRDDFLKPGDSKACPLLPSVYHSRLAHRPLGWAGCDISRAPDNQTISVPAGKFATLLYEVRISDGRVGKFWIEHAYPHRIVRWELAPDVAAEMTGSARLKYWQLHNNGDESYLKQLGLKPTVE